MKEVRDVLWTGGWDSTFRVVELLARTEKVVQPHYIRDPERVSARLELETMDRLRGMLADRISDAGSRLLPLMVTELRDIPPDQRIDNALVELRRMGHLGYQYAYIARYAYLVARKPLELGIENDRSGNVGRLLLDRLVVDDSTTPRRYRLEEREDALSEIFRWFDFPIADYDKHQMRDLARRWGMEPILAKTWFCHRPWLGRYSCGTCRPCVYIMNERQTWRMGVAGRLRFALIERPKRVIPASAKGWLRQRAGRRLRSFLRA